MDFTFSTDTILAALAFIVSVYSVWYTRHFNKYSIEVADFETEIDRELNLLSFNVYNTSTRPIKIDDIKIMYQGKIVRSVNLDIDKYDYQKRYLESSSSMFAQTLSYAPPALDPRLEIKTPTVLQPNETVEFCAYFKETPNEVSVTANHFVGKFSKTKSFMFD